MALERVVLVLGAPRSGTGYLCNVLDAHADLAVGQEWRLPELAGLAGWLVTHGPLPEDRAGLAVGAEAIALGRAFQARPVHKAYTALAVGRLQGEGGARAAPV